MASRPGLSDPPGVGYFSDFSQIFFRFFSDTTTVHQGSACHYPPSGFASERQRGVIMRARARNLVRGSAPLISAEINSLPSSLDQYLTWPRLPKHHSLQRLDDLTSNCRVRNQFIQKHVVIESIKLGMNMLNNLPGAKSLSRFCQSTLIFVAGSLKLSHYWQIGF